MKILRLLVSMLAFSPTSWAIMFGEAVPAQDPIRSVAVIMPMLVIVVMPVLMIVPVVVIRRAVGFGPQPALDVHALGGRVIEPGVEQKGRLDLALYSRQDRRARIEMIQPVLEAGDGLGRRDIGLGQDDAVGHR